MTTPDVDLTDVIDDVAALLIDRCEIRFDRQGKSDDKLNPVTGKLEPPPGDDTRLYPVIDEEHPEIVDGPCMLASAGSVNGAQQSANSRPTPTRSYRLSLPLVDELGHPTPLIPRGAVVRMTACFYDSQIVEQTFTVTGDVESTYPVFRVVEMERARA